MTIYLGFLCVLYLVEFALLSSDIWLLLEISSGLIGEFVLSSWLDLSMTVGIEDEDDDGGVLTCSYDGKDDTSRK